MPMGSSSSMKVHPFARGFIWDHHQQIHDNPPSLTLGCKRFRSLAPKLASINVNASSFDLKSFIKPESGPRKIAPDEKDSSAPHQVETHPGGTRWNPTQEQIGILEMLYKGGMRTPNAQQIEHITEQLGKYGKIEGKNVFYWFQNHKARERQKQKRSILGLSNSPGTPSPVAVSPDTSITSTLDITRVENEQQQEISPYKRKIRGWTFEHVEDMNTRIKNNEDEEGDQTLELFPLHPEGK